MFLHHTTILTLIISLTALPTFPAQPTTPSSPLHRRDPRCHDVPLHIRKPLDNSDCLVTLSMLPVAEAIGTFSLHAPVNAQQFRLPRHFAYRSCMIGITMATTGVIGDEDTSSWIGIMTKTLQIIRQCVQRPSQPLDKVGGSENVGARGRIKVDVFHNQPYLRFLVDLNKPTPEPVLVSPSGSTS